MHCSKTPLSIETTGPSPASSSLAYRRCSAASILAMRRVTLSALLRPRCLHARHATTVGFVGAGNMGQGMAASLARAGLNVAQYDRDAAALAASASASPLIEAVGSLEELCSKSQTVVVSVAGEPAERAVFLGSGGLLEVAPKGSLFIDAGTVSVEFARELHTASAAAGMSFLDAPVSGGPEGAAKGTLSIMVGGSEADFDAAKPALDGMGGYVVRMGEPGAGAAAKLINQLLTASNALAATEALALAKAMGFESEAQLGEHCRAGARTPGKHALATTPARMPVLSGTRCVCVCGGARVVWRAGAAAAAAHRRRS